MISPPWIYNHYIGFRNNNCRGGKGLILHTLSNRVIMETCHRQTDRLTNIQIERQTYRWIDMTRLTERQMDRQDKLTNRLNWKREDRQIDKETDRQTDRLVNERKRVLNYIDLSLIFNISSYQRLNFHFSIPIRSVLL